jgi:hypothetical protein
MLDTRPTLLLPAVNASAAEAITANLGLSRTAGVKESIDQDTHPAHAERVGDDVMAEAGARGERSRSRRASRGVQKKRPESLMNLRPFAVVPTMRTIVEPI